MAIYIHDADNTISAKLAVTALTDYLPEDTDGVRIIAGEETAWAAEVADKLGVRVVKTRAVFTHTDTVIGPPVEALVAKACEAGATYLDLSQGLVQVEVDVDVEVPDSPDTEVLPEPKPKPTRKRAARKPLPEIPQEEPVKADPIPAEAKPAASKVKNDPKKEATVTVTDIKAQPLAMDLTPAAMLRQLVYGLINDADESTLWAVTDVLRAR